MEQVCESYELLSLILEGLPKQDLHSCCLVSHIWRDCSTGLLKLKYPGYLVPLQALQDGLRMFKLFTNQSDYIKLPTKDNYKVMRCFEDVVVLYHEMTQKLFIGNPIRYPGKWKALPESRNMSLIYSVFLGRLSTGDLVLIIVFMFRIATYCFTTNSWIDNRAPRFCKRSSFALHGDWFYACTLTCIWRCNMTSMVWTQVHATNVNCHRTLQYPVAGSGDNGCIGKVYELNQELVYASNGDLYCSPAWGICLTRRNGKLLIAYIGRVYEWKEGRLEERERVDCFFGNGNKVFWIVKPTHRDGYEVVMYSDLDKRYTKVREVDEYSEYDYYIGDGDAFSQFSSLPWYKQASHKRKRYLKTA